MYFTSKLLDFFFEGAGPSATRAAAGGECPIYMVHAPGARSGRARPPPLSPGKTGAAAGIFKAGVTQTPGSWTRGAWAQTPGSTRTGPCRPAIAARRHAHAHQHNPSVSRDLTVEPSILQLSGKKPSEIHYAFHVQVGPPGAPAWF